MTTEHPTGITSRYRNFTGFWEWLTIGFSILGIVLAVYHIFHFQAFGFMLMDNSYLYLLLLPRWLVRGAVRSRLSGPESDLEEPIHLLLAAASRVSEVPQDAVT